MPFPEYATHGGGESGGCHQDIITAYAQVFRSGSRWVFDTHVSALPCMEQTELTIRVWMWDQSGLS